MTAPPRALKHRALRFALAATIASLVVCQSAHSENVCATKASLENPVAAMQPGLDASAAPEPRTLGAWWQGLWGKGTDGKSSNDHRPNLVAGRPGMGGTGINSGGVGGTGIDSAGIGGTGISNGGALVNSGC